MKEAESPALFDKALKISFSSFDVEDPFRDGFPPLSSLRDGGFSRWRRNVPGTEYTVYGAHLFMTFRREETEFYYYSCMQCLIIKYIFLALVFSITIEFIKFHY